MNRFLTSTEYNDLTKVVFNSIDYKYGTEIYRKNMDRIFDIYYYKPLLSY